jgi:3-dehydroquinate synthase
MGIIMILRMELGEQSYDIAVGRGLLGEAGKLLNLKRKVLIVTDTGVPDEYAKSCRGMPASRYIYISAGRGQQVL